MYNPATRERGRVSMQRTSKLSVCLLFFAATLLFASAAHAQGVGASADIVGTSTDPSGAAIPKAKVTATDTAKGISRTTFTDDHGEYRLTSLAPSTYDLGAEAQSFQSAVEHNVVLTVGQIALI